MRNLKHGRFCTAFVSHEFARQLHNDLTNGQENFIQIKELFKSYSNNNIPDKHLFWQICMDFLAMFFKFSINKRDRNYLKESIDRDLRVCKCTVCGKEYQQLLIPTWVYYRTNGNTGICYECPLPKKLTKDALLLAIKELIDHIGFIPNSDFYQFKDNSFAARITPEKWNRAYKLFLNFYSRKEDIIKTNFDTWFHALVQSGVLKDDQLVTKRGIKCVAKSGNICNSLAEYYVDN